MNKRRLFTIMAVITFTAVSGFAQTEPSPNAHWSGTVFELTRSGAANVKVPALSSLLSKELGGTWSGTVKTSSQSLRVVLTMATDADGRATGLAKAVDAGNQEFPIATIIQTGRQLEFEIRGAIHVTFSGSLDESGTQITGIWKEGTDSLPFTAQRTKP